MKRFVLTLTLVFTTTVLLLAQPTLPVMHSVEENPDGDGFTLTWKANPEDENASYRLYYTTKDDLSGYEMLASEDVLTGLTTSYDATSLTPNDKGYHFYLTAINDNGESAGSDVYSALAHEDMTNKKKALVVDGFDRHNASYTEPTHPFATTYMKALRSTGKFSVATCANEAVEDEVVSLADYDMVVWFTGDESTDDTTLTPQNQVKLSTYLNNGGNLLITGAEFGWDLVQDGTDEDKAFYSDYLKAEFVFDGNGSNDNFPAVGAAGTPFEGINLTFGQVYPEDWPDEIAPLDGAIKIMTYLDGTTSGIGYKGTFGDGTEEGGLIYISFALETVSDAAELNAFMDAAENYLFGNPANIELPEANDKNIQVYPSVISKNATLRFNLPQPEALEMAVYTIQGRKMLSREMTIPAGKNTREIDLSHLKSGIYIIRFEGSTIKHSLKIIRQ